MGPDYSSEPWGQPRDSIDDYVYQSSPARSPDIQPASGPSSPVMLSTSEPQNGLGNHATTGGSLSRPNTPIRSPSARRLQRNVSTSSALSSNASSPSGSPQIRPQNSLLMRSKSQSTASTPRVGEADTPNNRSASFSASGTTTPSRPRILVDTSEQRSDSPASTSGEDSSSLNPQTGPNSTFSSPARSRSTSNAT